jgi:uncharacterized protein
VKRDEAIRIISEHQDELRRRGVERLAIFGSTARNQAGTGSDVDILVELDRTRPFGVFDFVRLQSYLEEILGCPVDLGTPESLKPRMREKVLEERIFVA